ncbi:hypothetical protein SPRG_11427 [Saprolegnia parasitica CBS 223.65]|uniref:Small-subunit processome Utp12 domain-containing protein n=1 Tax=Saprolegnia parasitica (strain CBS 223.65) TaxID=695850 RepID=A0A067C2Z0_SAPPC|nr:hypothetical protein SPRG_11427 [Saprolegnia parasitica CBS 223.65]KDO23505.1 hypothetical protein SPRG_11427 [Saprolegnia parasitica CBS 223.65]|eukprot:XP_012205818.1 hypothetical protein SPRG_11427 [Saprolegnia parasitica CBS 223.65]
MKFAYEFSHLCGTVYTQGNVVFTPDGNALLSPVGNRITMFDLINNSSRTFAFESRSNVHAMAVSHDSRLLIAVDEDGHSLLVNLKKGIVLYRFNFKAPVRALRFSPDDKYIAVTHGAKIQVWKAPGLKREFAPFVHHRTYGGHHGDVLTVEWSPDSKFFLSSAKDLSVRLWSITPYPTFTPYSFVGHRDVVMGAFFSEDGSTVYTIGRDGGAYRWEHNYDDMDDDLDDDDETPILARGVKWSTKHKHVFKMEYAKIDCVAFHAASSLLTVGFGNGTFGLYSLPDFADIHTLSVTQHRLSSVAINASGEWLALASQTLGQLLVWEWKSETYVLKQQGHFFDLNALAYSPDGRLLATGADDAKLKLWDTTSGFCYVTFHEHQAPVTGVAFTANGQAVVSCSLDGTVRAFDLNRYKNFRVLTTPNPVQFLSLALDTSGQIVCAGTLDPFHIYVWSLQTGRLTDVLSGHTAPVTSLAFSPSTTEELLLASDSWDHTVRVWNVYQNKPFVEPLAHSSDVLAVAFRPDGKQVCSATLNGQLNLWNIADGEQVGQIDGQKDVSGGRHSTDAITAKNNTRSKHFTSVCYSADGSVVLAGGQSKYICIYEVASRSHLLLKKFQLTHNRSLEGVLDKLHTAELTEAGSKKSLDLDVDPIDGQVTKDNQLVGAKRAVDPGARRKHLDIFSKAVLFSPTGRSWAAATTEGLLIYSLDETLTFDPFDLDEDITPDTIRATLARHEFTKALLMSLHLNEEPLIRLCLESVPNDSIVLVAQSLTDTYLKRLLTLLAKGLGESPHLEFYLSWSLAILNAHGPMLQAHSVEFLSTLRALQKSIVIHFSELSRVCNDNQYTLDYLRNLNQLQIAQAASADSAME